MLDPWVHVVKHPPRVTVTIDSTDQQIREIPFVLRVLLHKLSKAEFIGVKSTDQFAEKGNPF